METLVALLSTTGLLILMAGLVAHHQRATRILGDRIEGIEAARVARDLISGALAADPGARVDGATLFVRTFVGVAERCGETAWRYRGRRLPDPERDSLWSVTAGGTVQLTALRSAAQAECPDGSGNGALELGGEPLLASDVVLVRVYEAGRFRVDDALRYGRVGTGAQPLTAAVLDPRRSGISHRSGPPEIAVVPRARKVGFEGRWGR